MADKEDENYAGCIIFPIVMLCAVTIGFQIRSSHERIDKLEHRMEKLEKAMENDR